jgi:hypothetical protein
LSPPRAIPPHREPFIFFGDLIEAELRCDRGVDMSTLVGWTAVFDPSAPPPGRKHGLTKNEHNLVDEYMMHDSGAFPVGVHGPDQRIGALGGWLVTLEHLQCAAPRKWANDDLLNFEFSRINYVNEEALQKQKIRTQRPWWQQAAAEGGKVSAAVRAAGAGSAASESAEAAAAFSLGARGCSGGVPRVHVWNSHFLSALLEPWYDYNACRRKWTSKAGIINEKTLLSIDLWLVPVNISNLHWALAVLDVRSKTLHYYDSLAPDGGRGFGQAEVPGKPLTAADVGVGGDGEPAAAGEGSGCNATTVTLQAILQWWSHVTADILGVDRRVDTCTWPIRRYSSLEIPTQDNGSDCGFFAINYARCIAEGLEWDFNQADMADLRKQTVLRVLEAGPIGALPPRYSSP